MMFAIADPSSFPALSPVRSLRRLVSLVLTLLLCGCMTDLYTKQSENDANLMLSALLESHIAAQKVSLDAGKTWNLQVDKQDVVNALAVLQAQGLPKARHVTLGDMFKKEGLISTPTEERVRFIYGVQQQTESTLEQIDGVVTARVHIVLPNNDPLATTVKPASASVFVKYLPQANLAGLTPSIKTMVARSVEGLSYENVTVTMVPGTPVALRARGDSSTGWWAALAAGVLVLLAGGGWLAWKPPGWMPEALRRRGPTASAATSPILASEAASP